jgi:hypothetical protein
MSSKSIHTLAYAKISIVLKAVIYFIAFIHHIKFIFSYINERLGWIHLSAVVNNSSVTVDVQIFFKNLLMIWGIGPWVKKLGHIVTQFISFWKKTILLSIVCILYFHKTGTRAPTHNLAKICYTIFKKPT